MSIWKHEWLNYGNLILNNGHQQCLRPRVSSAFKDTKSLCFSTRSCNRRAHRSPFLCSHSTASIRSSGCILVTSRHTSTSAYERKNDQSLRALFLEAAEELRIEDMLRYYGLIKESVHSSSVAEDAEDGEFFLRDALKAISSLSKTREPLYAESILQILDDCKNHFNFPSVSGLLASAMKALVTLSQVDKAHELVSSSSWASNVDHWGILLRTYHKAGDIQALQQCIISMAACGTTPSVGDFELLVGLALNGQSISPILKIFDQMRELGLSHSSSIVELLRTKTRSSMPLRSYGKILEDEYQKRFGTSIKAEQMLRFRNELKSTLDKKGVRSIVGKVPSMRKVGFVPDRGTLILLADKITTLSELRALERALQVKADSYVWAILIRNTVSERTLETALKFYEEAKREDVAPDSVMIHPLLRGLCSSLKNVTEMSLDKALSIYEDVKRAAAGNAGKFPDIAVFNTLLRALAASSNKNKYFPIALNLLEDMKAKRVRFDHMTATSFAILFLRSSPTYEDAIRLYHEFRSLDPTIFDGKGYIAILNTFCNLKLDPVSVPPAKDFLMIMRDMQRQGYPMSPEIYTILLRRYAYLADQMRRPNHRDHKDRIVMLLSIEAAIRRIHKALKLDASVTPDVPLWNQLMDCYNRVGAFGGAIKVWNALRYSRTMNNVSVSIILDACGYAGEHATAISIWSGLLQSDLKLNRRNWDAWVECLCRLNQLEEAVEVVCVEMSRYSAESQPTKEAINILLSFATKTGQRQLVEKRISQALPHLDLNPSK